MNKNGEGPEILNIPFIQIDNESRERVFVFKEDGIKKANRDILC